MAQVRLTLEAEEGKALQSFMRVVDVQKKVEGGLDAVTRASKLVEQQLTKQSQSQQRLNELALNNSMVFQLQQQANLGQKAARVALERLRITQEFRREEEALHRVLTSNVATERDRATAQQRLNALGGLRDRRLRQAGGGGFDFGGFVGGSTGAAGMGRGLMSSAAGVLGVLGISLAVGEITRTIIDQLQRQREDMLRFNRSIMPLLAANGNAGNAGAVRDQVLARSGGLARDPGEVAGAMRALTTLGANMPSQTRDRVFLKASQIATLQGGSVEGTTRALLSAQGAFGNQVANPEELADKMFFAADRSGGDLQQLTGEFATLSVNMKANNATLDETIATYVSLARALGDGGKAMNALNNLFEKLPQAQAQGVQLTGTLIDQIKQLEAVPTDTKRKIFGDKDMAVLQLVITNLAAIRAELKQIDSAAGETSRRLTQLYADPTTRATQQAAVVGKMTENAPLAEGPRNFDRSADYARLSILPDLPTWIPFRKQVANVAALAAAETDRRDQQGDTFMGVGNFATPWSNWLRGKVSAGRDKMVMNLAGKDDALAFATIMEDATQRRNETLKARGLPVQPMAQQSPQAQPTAQGTDVDPEMVAYIDRYQRDRGIIPRDSRSPGPVQVNVNSQSMDQAAEKLIEFGKMMIAALQAMQSRPMQPMSRNAHTEWAPH